MQELRKKWRLRASVGLLAIAFGIAVDEALKEGYVFMVSDLFNPVITHEKLFLVFLVLGLLLGLRRWER